MTHTTVLRDWTQARDILTRSASWIKRRITAGHPVVLTLDDERRSIEQNALLHALIAEIAASHEWAGKRRDVETWKRLFVAAWCRANGESVEILPALDGVGVDVVFRRTSRMSKAEVSDMIDWIEAWRATQ